MCGYFLATNGFKITYDDHLINKEISSMKKLQLHYFNKEHIFEVAEQIRIGIRKRNLIAPHIIIATDSRLLIFKNSFYFLEKEMKVIEYERITSSTVFYKELSGATIKISIPSSLNKSNELILMDSLPKDKAQNINRIINDKIKIPKNKTTFRSSDIDRNKQYVYDESEDVEQEKPKKSKKILIHSLTNSDLFYNNELNMIFYKTDNGNKYLKNLYYKIFDNKENKYFFFMGEKKIFIDNEGKLYFFEE